MVSAHIEVPFRIARTMLFLLCLVLVAFALILSSVASAQTCASRPGYPVGYWDEILTQSGYGNPCGTLAGPNYFCTAVWDFFPAYGGTTGSITPDIYPTSPDFFTSTAIQPGAAWSSQDVNGPWGRVTGTVSADGCQISVSYDGKVQDSIGTLTYAGSTPAPLEILTTTLPPDTLNASGQYCASLVATGGTGDYQWSATGLPSGFTTFEPGESLLCQTAPVTPGTYLVTLTVNGTATTPSPLTLVVSSLQITPPTLLSVAAGLKYMQAFTASGGTGYGYTWCVLDGGVCDPNPASPAESTCDLNSAPPAPLPAGFTFSAQGLLSSTGSPIACVGNYPFTVQVTDAAGNRATQALSLEILCPINIIQFPSGQSGSGLPDQMMAEAYPPNNQNLQDYATACGYSNFDWQQYVTMAPAHIDIYAESGATLTPEFLDPPLGGYTYQFDSDGLALQSWLGAQPHFATAFPFLYSTLDLENGYIDISRTLPIEAPYQLNFFDAPNDDLCAYPNACMALSTQLVGVCNFYSTAPSCEANAGGPTDAQGNWASLPLAQWTWTSNLNCPAGVPVQDACALGTGEISVNSTLSIYQLPIGAGTGGVAITSINGVPSPPISVDPSTSTVLASEPLSVGITVGQFQGEPVPAGTVTLTSGSYTSTAATLNGNGAANITIPAGSLAVGSDLLTVAYTPATPVSATYSQAWGTAMVTVNPVAPEIVFVPTPSSQVYGTPIAAGSLDATAQYDGNSVTGAFVYTTGACGGAGQVLVAGATVLQVGSYSITACFTPSETGLAAASATVQYSVTPASQSISFGPLAAQLVGATIPLNATATSGMAVGFQSLTPTVCSVSQSMATTLSPGTCTILATQSGGVDYNSAYPVQVSFPVMGFNLTAEPASETIKRGVLGVFLLEVKSVNGFAGNVNISCTGGPPDSVCGDFPQTVRVRANGTTLALAGILFRPQDAEGTYTIAFTGVSGTDTSTATAVFTVK